MTTPRTTGATAAGAGEKRTLWPWLLLAALIAGLLLWWLIASLDDDGDDLDTDATTAVTETTEAVEDDLDPTETEATEDAAPTSPTTVDVVPVGFVYVGDVDVLDPAADVGALAGEQVEANTVDVVQLVADEAFYVGEPGRTIMVRLENFAGEGAPESPFEVEVGDQISFTGTLREIDDAFLSELQLFEGVEQVELGDYYVQADDITLMQ
jgi:hypothetical protein